MQQEDCSQIDEEVESAEDIVVGDDFLGKQKTCDMYTTHVFMPAFRAHPLEPELPSAIQYFVKYSSCQIECFVKAMVLHRHIRFEFESSAQVSFEDYFQRTINCPITRVNENEPTLLCDVRYATMDKFS